MRNTQYLVAVSTFTPFGPARLKLLLSYFKSAKKVWTAPYDILINVGLSRKIVEEFIRYRNGFDIDKYFVKLNELGIEVVTFKDKDFPKSIKALEDPPRVLYYKGSLKGLLSPSVAIVGSRKMTSYGREVAQIFSGQLADSGVTIISGLARGIDTTAHRSCLLKGGITVAVLGNGLDTVYPPENASLAREIIQKGGAIISEFPLGCPALPANFVIRNRIISGLSSRVLIVEGAKKSGTLITASYAANQGKVVFAVPGQITSPMSQAPLFLIKNGANIAIEPKDILDDLGIASEIRKKGRR